MIKYNHFFNITNENINKLRPLSPSFKIQFGQEIKTKKSRGKLIKTWICNTRFYKRRRKAGLIIPSKAKYHCKKARSSLKLYKVTYLKFNTFPLVDFHAQFLLNNKNWLKNILKSSCKLNLKYTKLKKILKMKKRKQRKNNFNVFMKTTKKRARRLRGKISFVNIWITFFHKYNLRKLRLTIARKNFTKLDNFIYHWKNLLDQKMFSLYFLYSFYIFRTVFVKKRAKNFAYFNPKDKCLLVNISYNHIVFFLLYISFFKTFLNISLLKLNFNLSKETNLLESNKNMTFFGKLILLEDKFVSLKEKKNNLNKVKRKMTSAFLKPKTFVASKKFFVLKEKTFDIILNNSKFLLKHLYAWLFFKNSFNKAVYKKLFHSYNVWIFYINYALNYYLLSKLYFVFLNYFFFIIFRKFVQIGNILKLKKFELCYDFIKLRDNSRYHLGIRPHAFVTTFNRRIKKGSLCVKFYLI